MRRGGPEHIDVLSRVEYSITVTHKEGATRTYQVTIEIGDPPGGEVRVDSTDPADRTGRRCPRDLPRALHPFRPRPQPEPARPGKRSRDARNGGWQRG